MFKVLIIDDEPIIRKGLRNVINWKQFDCEVCCEAGDGQKGKELIKIYMPDIIITDIKMPEEDGLTMISEIREVVPDAKIIILTGYRNFEYIQESIKLGVFDFILKPSKIEEITATIFKAVKELKLQKERIEENRKLKEQFEQNIPVLREKLLYDIIYGINNDRNEIDAKMELFRLKINCFVLAVIESDDEDIKTAQYDIHLYQFGIINTFNEIFSDTFKINSISLDNKHIAFIIQPYNNIKDYIGDIYEKCTYLQDMIQNCFGFTVTIAISTEGHCAYELSTKLKECRQALEYKTYIGNNSIIPYNDLHSFFGYKKDYSLFEEYRISLLESIKTGNEEMVNEILQHIFDYANGLGNSEKEYLKSFYSNIISSINDIRTTILTIENKENIGRNEIESLYITIKKSTSISTLNSILQEVICGITTEVKNFNRSRIKFILQNAIEYIQEHYNKQITLKDVAEHVYVSTCYISRMFKKELGKNFVDYLNEIRIEKAKELLKNIKYKTYEVAELVGIGDPHYFSKLFKKYTGITPSEYRDLQKIR